jgi:hypothetical protein
VYLNRDACTSILTSDTGLVLVDPPIQDTYVSLRGNRQIIIKTPSFPLFGGTEDLLPVEIAHKHSVPSTSQPMLEQLLYSWMTVRSTDFTSERLTLRALSYYPLRFIAAEWVSYLAVMCFSLRHNDKPPRCSTYPTEDFDRINMALTSISSWPRRVASSLKSLSKSVSFIKHHGQAETVSDSWAMLQEDYEYLAHSLLNQGKQLEATIPVVTTYLQLAESRRAYMETKNVSRVTMVALVFVPLSFVSSLFSMNEAFTPGGPRFWLYFVVAFPVLILVLLFAKLSNLDYNFHRSWFQKWNRNNS